MILYKYYPEIAYSFKALSVRGLWCHYPINMNDPFECLGYLNRKFTSEEVDNFKSILSKSPNKRLIKFSKSTNDEIVAYINEQRKESIKRYAFCSLSETYNDIKMWSHYASGHTGFVIGIEFNENDIDHHFQKVRYLEKLPKYDTTRLAELLNGNYEHLAYLFSDISIKTKDWSEEKEWRIWRLNPCYYHYKTENIKSIFFGVNCSWETKAIVSRLTSDLKKGFLYTEMEFGDNPIRLKY